MPPNGDEMLGLLVVGLRPKTLTTSARRSSLIWINAWQNWRKRIEDSEQARTSPNSPPLETHSLASRQNRHWPVRAESSRRGSRVWRADGRPLSKRCRPLVFHPTSKFHRQPPTLFPHPPHLPVLFPPSYLRLQLSTPSHQLLLSQLPSSNIVEEFESTHHLARVATVESDARLTRRPCSG